MQKPDSASLRNSQHTSMLKRQSPLTSPGTASTVAGVHAEALLLALLAAACSSCLAGRTAALLSPCSLLPPGGGRMLICSKQCWSFGS